MSALSAKENQECEDKLNDRFSYKALWFYKHFLDTDENGVLSIDDFQRSALKYATIYCKGSYVEETWEKFKSLWSTIWTHLRNEADRNKDNKIDFDEWRDFLEKMTISADSFEELPEWLRELAELQFGVVDIKGDGVIDVNEYRLWLCSRNMSIHDASKCFSTLTKTSDEEVLTKQEWCSLWYHFLTDHEPDAAGDYILGPMDSANRKTLLMYLKSALAWEWKRRSLSMHLC